MVVINRKYLYSLYSYLWVSYLDKEITNKAGYILRLWVMKGVVQLWLVHLGTTLLDVMKNTNPQCVRFKCVCLVCYEI